MSGPSARRRGAASTWRRRPSGRSFLRQVAALIADWADALHPGFPATTSYNDKRTDHDGVFYVAEEDVPEYVKTYKPTILRWNKDADTQGFPAQNMKASKGCTFDRVLIFPTDAIRNYLKRRDPSTLKTLSLATLYVAVTRARHS